MSELSERLQAASGAALEQEIIDEPCCSICGEELDGEPFPFCLGCELQEGQHCSACPCIQPEVVA